MTRRRRPILRRGAPLLAGALLTVGCAPDAGQPTTQPASGDTADPAAGAGGSSADPAPAPATDDTSTEPASTSSPGGADDGDPSPPPTTTATAPADAPAEQPPAGCRRLTDFDDAGRWVVVNDGVMGGQSAGAVEIDGSTMRFTGTVVTDGGGFTSVRLPLDDELSGTDRVELRLRPDDRVYAVTFESDSLVGERFVSYGAELAEGRPSDGGGWRVAAVSYDELGATVFGSPVEAPPFDADAASEIGIIIADGVDGEFALEVDWIDACR